MKSSGSVSRIKSSGGSIGRVSLKLSGSSSFFSRKDKKDLVPEWLLMDLEEDILPSEEIETLESIGEGSFATVYRASFRGEIVAFKELKTEFEGNSMTEEAVKVQVYDEFRAESSVMKALQKCPYVVRMIGICKEPAGVVMEYCSEGSLRTFLSRQDIGEHLTWRLRHKICLDIAKAMDFMHSIDPPIIHRDIKSLNILLNSIDVEDDVVAKMTDFGTCVTSTKITARVVDNPLWLAPEIMKGWEYSPKADIYSYAMVLYEVASLNYPFDEFDHNTMPSVKVERLITEGLRPSIPIQKTPEEFELLIRKCWVLNPCDRPSAAQIIKMLDQMFLNLKNLPFDWVDPNEFERTLCTTYPIDARDESIDVSVHVRKRNANTNTKNRTKNSDEKKKNTKSRGWSTTHAGKRKKKKLYSSKS